MRMHESYQRRNGQVAEQVFDDVNALSRLIEVLEANVGTITEASYDKRYRQAKLSFGTAGEVYGWSLSGVKGDEKFLDIAYLLVANFSALQGKNVLPEAMAVWSSMDYSAASPEKLHDASRLYKVSDRIKGRWHAVQPPLQRALVAALNLTLPDDLHYRDFTPGQILQAWYVSEGDSGRLSEALTA